MAADEWHEITVRTDRPHTWRFVDTDTGQVWRWHPADGFSVDDHDAITYGHTILIRASRASPDQGWHTPRLDDRPD